MRRLLTLTMCAVSLGASAQIPSLPYNPDENGDGLIGVADLQGLLALYSQEFSAAVLSEDGEMAVMNFGNAEWPECVQTCDGLPGNWKVPTIDEVGMVWEDIRDSDYTWLSSRQSDSEALTYWGRTAGAGTRQLRATWGADDMMQCFCVTRELRKVEYDFCRGSGNNGLVALENLKSCVDEKLQSGWQLLGPSRDADREDVFIQALWRWAD